MEKIKLKEAQNKLSEILDQVAGGEEILITREDGSSFKIIPTEKQKPHPKFGSAKGKIKIFDDFDAPLDDFKDYMP